MDKSYYKTIMSGGDQFAIMLALISNILDSEETVEDKLRYIEMVKDAGMEAQETREYVPDPRHFKNEKEYLAALNAWRRWSREQHG